MAELSFVHCDTDGAFANGELIRRRFAALPRSALGSHWLCSLHGNKLVETAALGVLSLKLVSGMCSVGLLFRMGGHFLRLVHALPRIVDADLDIRLAPPPPWASAYADKVCDYLRCHYKSFDVASYIPEGEGR
eukprot:1897495-Pyramimonas_sp.AAC.1